MWAGCCGVAGVAVLVAVAVAVWPASATEEAHAASPGRHRRPLLPGLDRRGRRRADRAGRPRRPPWTMPATSCRRSTTRRTRCARGRWVRRGRRGRRLVQAGLSAASSTTPSPTSTARPRLPLQPSHSLLATVSRSLPSTPPTTGARPFGGRRSFRAALRILALAPRLAPPRGRPPRGTKRRACRTCCAGATRSSSRSGTAAAAICLLVIRSVTSSPISRSRLVSDLHPRVAAAAGPRASARAPSLRSSRRASSRIRTRAAGVELALGLAQHLDRPRGGRRPRPAPARAGCASSATCSRAPIAAPAPSTPRPRGPRRRRRRCASWTAARVRPPAPWAGAGPPARRIASARRASSSAASGFPSASSARATFSQLK